LQGRHALQRRDRSPLKQRDWTLDALGNWHEFKQSDDTDAAWELEQQRKHNSANEIDDDNIHGSTPYGDSGDTNRY